MPASYNTKAEIREIEPYVYNQFINSIYSPRYGAARLPWLSGSAAWAYYTATQFILGVQPDYLGLRIDPCLPSKWREVKITRRFQKKNFNIVIINEKAIQKGVSRLIINDKPLDGNLIPFKLMKKNNEVVVVMG